MIFSKQNVMISLREEYRDCEEIDTTLIFISPVGGSEEKLMENLSRSMCCSGVCDDTQKESARSLPLYLGGRNFDFESGVDI